jgi:predicted O-methyltransferase YrrM
MNNAEVKNIVADLPHMSLPQADYLSAFIDEHDIQDILELGFAHGVSSCYMAAAIQRRGKGRLTTIDRNGAKGRKPSINELLERTGLSKHVSVYFEPTSYNWRLMKFLEQDTRPQFDLCYLDGAHDWFVDGFAFCLTHLLLRPGGWIIFDDIEWTYASSPTLRDTELVRKMPEDEKSTPHVRKVYELLVRSNPDYHNFRVENGWAFAQKKSNTSGFPLEREVIVEKVILVQKKKYGLGWLLATAGKKITRRLAKKN